MSMSNESPIDAVEMLRLWRPYWLPPNGTGNGLDALYWVELARIPERLSPGALAELAVEGIPAWVAPVPGYRKVSRRGEREMSLSVATIEFDAAQEVVMRLLSADEHTPGHESDSPVNR